MNENITLTPLEQRIMSLIGEMDIISMKELYDLFPDHSKAVLLNTASSMKRKGYLISLKKGFFMIVKDGFFDPDRLIKIAPLIYGGYVAFSSALSLHSLLDYHPFTIFVSTVDRSRKLEWDQYEIRFISMGSLCTGQILKDDIWVSNMEKTLFDCFYKPQYGGGYQNITKAIYQAENIRWDRFGFYIEKYGKDPLAQRIGYILDTMKDVTGMEIPDDLIKDLLKRVKKTARLSASSSQSGRYIEKWKVQDNVQRDTFLGWWY